MWSELASRLPPITLPADAANQLDTALAACPKPKCTELPDVNELRAALETNGHEVLRTLYPTSPGTLALLATLVKRTVAPVSIEREGDATLSLDLTVSPRRGHALVSGDVTIRGDLDLSAALVIAGDLNVTGTITDCGPESRIVVLGTIRCGNLVTSSEVFAGALEATGLVYGSYNDNVLELVGSLRAEAILSSDHSIEAAEFLPRRRPETAGDWGDDIFDVFSEAGLAELQRRMIDGCVVPGRGDRLTIDFDAIGKLGSPWREQQSD